MHARARARRHKQRERGGRGVGGREWEGEGQGEREREREREEGGGVKENTKAKHSLYLTTRWMVSEDATKLTSPARLWLTCCHDKHNNQLLEAEAQQPHACHIRVVSWTPPLTDTGVHTYTHTKCPRRPLNQHQQHPLYGCQQRSLNRRKLIQCSSNIHFPFQTHSRALPTPTAAAERDVREGGPTTHGHFANSKAKDTVN